MLANSPVERGKFGLALAGGGPLGAIYTAGALLALDEALVGRRLVAFDTFVGVSSGSFFAAALANAITPRALVDIYITGDAEDVFDPGVLMRPAFPEFGRFLTALASRSWGAAGAWWHTRRGAIAALERLAATLPPGIFDTGSISGFAANLLRQPGRVDDFHDLRKQLFVVATDLDSGEVAPFGAPGWRDIPISTAIAASAALPGLYPPVQHQGRSYVDGALRKTFHASLALREGVGLLFAINPLVPFDARLAEREHGHKPPPLVQAGLPLVLSQTFRSLINSRVEAALGRYAHEFPDADLVMLQPGRGDPDMFFVNVFSYADRERLCEHAYQYTRTDLRARAADLAPVLARHGLSLDLAVLADPERRLRPGSSRTDLGETLRALDAGLNRLRAMLPVAGGLDHDQPE